MKKQSFNQSCYNLLQKVPKGKVTTYRDIAHALNCKAYRTVGNAMNKNPHPSNIVPCHRVIRSDGQVSGFASGTRNKIAMLRKEGIVIKNDRVDLIKFEHKF